MAERRATGEGHLREVAGVFLRLGFTAFGGPAAHIAMMRRELVERRGWLTDARFADLLGVVNLIPGPNSTELAIYLGYLRAGWPGLALAGVCFIGPAMLIVLALAAVYVASGSLPELRWALYGIQPVVVAIIAQALLGLGRTVLHGVLRVAVALAVLVLFLLGVNPLPLLFGGGVLYALLWLPPARKGVLGNAESRGVHAEVHGGQKSGTREKTEATHHDVGGSSESAQLPENSAQLRDTPSPSDAPPSLGALVAAAGVPFSQVTLFLTFLKIGAVLYGSGYVLLAFLRNDFVLRLHWLTDRQLLDAVSVGQFTPGPVFTTATFIGYVVGGVPGALLATLGIFLPSFVFVGLISRLADTLRRQALTSALLDGVNAAALGLMAAVLAQLGRAALGDSLTWALALVSLAVLLRFKLNSAWLILAGAIIGLLARGVFGA
jgi:chromate transporter